MTITADKILHSPEYFPLQFDGPDLVFVRMSRKNYHESIFTMPGRISLQTNEQWRVPFTQVVSLMQARMAQFPAPSFLFQIAHCGSTLLSRVLDMPETNLVIREPLVLRQLAVSPAASSTAQRASRQQALRALLSLLSRSYGDQPVLIKGNVPVNFLLFDMLELAPSLRGILLYSDLSDYLISILKSEDRKAWACYVAKEMYIHIQSVLPSKLPSPDLFTPAQAGAVLWHAQLQVFVQAVRTHNQLRLLNSKNVFSHPKSTLESANQCLQLGLNKDQVHAQVNSDMLQRDAKQPSKAYSSSQRAKDIAALNVLHQSELEQAITWSASMRLNEGLNLPEAFHLE